MFHTDVDENGHSRRSRVVTPAGALGAVVVVVGAAVVVVVVVLVVVEVVVVLDGDVTVRHRRHVFVALSALTVAAPLDGDGEVGAGVLHAEARIATPSTITAAGLTPHRRPLRVRIRRFPRSMTGSIVTESGNS
ncbi:MAG TPA: hypothetical protein VFC99_19490 [Acidimicrobiia bacterium]|nr:hypothetical protein [Acidimicrobiia bacterium]